MTTKDGSPGISVFEHLLNVGHVAQRLANSTPELLKEFRIEASTIAALAALHDLEKYPRAFSESVKHGLRIMDCRKLYESVFGIPQWNPTMEK